MTAVLFMQSVVLAIAALATSGVGLAALADGDASYAALPVAAILCGIGSLATGVVSIVALLAGIIRLGVG